MELWTPLKQLLRLIIYKIFKRKRPNSGCRLSLSILKGTVVAALVLGRLKLRRFSLTRLKCRWFPFLFVGLHLPAVFLSLQEGLKTFHLVNWEIRLNALDPRDQITIYLDAFGQSVVFGCLGKFRRLLVGFHSCRRLCFGNRQFLLQLSLSLERRFLLLCQHRRSFLKTMSILLERLRRLLRLSQIWTPFQW